MIQRLAVNLALVAASLLFSAAAIELLLRVAYPVYEAAARSQYERDDLRVWAPRANRVATRLHPDTGVPHPVIHNNLALRQSRDFDDLGSATNVAFFGDSFTTNNGLPAAYSFTEPLDYLLNTSGRRFNVLNFGVDGYGTDQAYLYYRDFDGRGALHLVFYVLCANDLRNIFETHLFSLDARGALVRNPLPEPAWWIRPLSRLHLTYLVLDLRQRLMGRAGSPEDYREAIEQLALRKAHDARFRTPRAGEVQQTLLRGEHSEDLNRTLAVFQRLLEQWKAEVESQGGRFYVVLLPTGQEERFASLLADDFHVISLFQLFQRAVPGFDWPTIQFRHDPHWAEEGNRLAARHLYQAIAPDLGLPDLGTEELDRRLALYYAAFPDGWKPKTGAPRDADPAALAHIRGKYTALETGR